jgi:hypothetical protein
MNESSYLFVDAVAALLVTREVQGWLPSTPVMRVHKTRVSYFVLTVSVCNPFSF